MQPKHFIAVLQETYERAYTILMSGGLPEVYVPGLAEVGVWAANECATNNWAEPERAGQIAAALLRFRHGPAAADEAMGLHAFVRLGMISVIDPPTRESAQSAPALPPV